MIKNIFIYIFFFLFLFSVSGIVISKSVDLEELKDLELSDHLELPTLIKIAFVHNSKIKAAYREWQATIEKLPQMTSLPDPMIMYGYFISRVETRVGPQLQRFGVSQSFPYPGTLNAAGEVQLKQIKIHQKKYEQAVRDVIVDIKLSYHELLYIDRAIEIVNHNQEILGHIIKLTKTYYAKDEATLSDLLKSESQQAQLSYDLILLYELREVEQANIRALLNIQPDTQLGKPVPIPYSPLQTPLEKLDKIALLKSQEIQVADLISQKAEKSIQLAKKKNNPMIKLELMTIDTGKSPMPDVMDNGKNPWLVSLGISVPIWSKKNKSQINEARLNYQKTLDNRESMKAGILANIRKVYFRMENARRLVELYENTMIPQAEKAIEITETWNQDSTPKNISGILETQSVWLNFNLAHARAIADYQQALVKLEKLTDGSLSEGKTENGKN
ncbi:hypothetical protein GF312_15540 [Candidatus Poribacteria bacterium]|nr:hypothetical protein [Candidatus Poribacteria bacterium]